MVSATLPLHEEEVLLANCPSDTIVGTRHWSVRSKTGVLQDIVVESLLARRLDNPAVTVEETQNMAFVELDQDSEAVDRLIGELVEPLAEVSALHSVTK